jgi:proteasome accessory factor C
MDLFHRIYRTYQILSSRRLPVSRATLEHELGCGRSTVNRIIAILRGYGAVIDYDKEHEGYAYNRKIAFELPGIWFTHDELFGLITAHDLLTSAEPSLLSETLQPLRAKLDKLLLTEKLGRGELPKRVRILRLAGRGPGKYFADVARALVERKQLQFDYTARTTGEDASRKVSPQRLTHYRDNWYLDAWCHDRRALRSFALERIRDARVSRLAARDIDEVLLHEHFASAYGIFAGQPKDTARLIFSAHRAQWVGEEAWHPKQVGVFLEDGRYQLDIPYSDTRELMMDILKNGPDVEVVSPAALRIEVQKKLAAALQKYTNAPPPKGGLHRGPRPAPNAAPDKGFGGVME